MTHESASPSKPETPLRIGVIGCGALGIIHAQRLAALPNVHICAVSDPDAGAMRNVAVDVPPHARGGQEEVARYPHYADLLKHEGLDAVCINSPNRWHVEQLLAALEHNLHVLCEKPLSMVPDEVSQVVEATQRSGRVVAIAYQSRYRRAARILRRAFQSRKWGKITSVNIFTTEDWITTNAGTWRHDPARCPGGFFADACGHQLDLLFWLTGLRTEWVRATTETRGTPVPMVIWGEARLSSDQTGESLPFTFTFVGDTRQWREEISIQAEGADFMLHDTQLFFSDGSAPFAPFPESEIDPVDLTLPDLPDTGFITALRGGPPIVSPPETVWPVLRFTLAALASAENGGAPQPV